MSSANRRCGLTNALQATNDLTFDRPTVDFGEPRHMTETCRAAVFLGEERYELRELPVPDPPPGGAVLAVEAVGLCGSDVAQFAGIELIPGGSTFPVVPGHETIGRVAALADDATLGVAVADRVAVNEIYSLDPMRVYGYSDMTGEGRLGLWGGYGEYMEILAGTELFPMSDRLPAEHVTLFEPLANAVNWVSVADVHEGETVVVQGPGHQGLAVLEAVLARNPAQVIVTGTSQDRLRLDAATAIGATHVVTVDVDDPRDGRARSHERRGCGRRVRHRDRDPRRCRSPSTSFDARAACCSRGSSTSRRSPGSSATTSCSAACRCSAGRVSRVRRWPRPSRSSSRVA